MRWKRLDNAIQRLLDILLLCAPLARSHASPVSRKRPLTIQPMFYWVSLLPSESDFSSLSFSLVTKYAGITVPPANNP